MYRVGILIFLCAIPMTAHAQILIQEIMYAPDGADADREWVEVCNTGSNSVDVSEWKLYENDTNHSLSLIEGSANLAEQACAVIADDTDAFKVDYPSFSGNLFDSAFSLRNTGETIILKDDSGDEVDLITYSDSLGAKDTGESLHRNGDTFYASAPSPGDFDGASESTQEASEVESPQSPADVVTTLYTYDSVTVQPPEDVHLRSDASVQALVGSYTHFAVETYDATGAAFQDGVVTWSFGDGGAATGRTVRHKYHYEGVYLVTVRVQRGSLFDEKHIQVVAMPTQVFIAVRDRGDVITITNANEFAVDISDWRIHSAGQYFSIPVGTHVAAGQSAHFPREITRLSFVTEDSEVQLVFPDGEVVNTNNEQPLQAIETIEHEREEEEVVQEQVPETKTEYSAPNIVIGMPVAGKEIKQYIANTETSSTAQTESKLESEKAAAAVILSQDADSEKGDVYWYFILAGLVALVVVGLLLVQPRTLRVHGFEIIEDKDE